jgi:hypothetical protein
MRDERDQEFEVLGAENFEPRTLTHPARLAWLSCAVFSYG